MNILRRFWIVTRYPHGQDLADAAFELQGVTDEQVREWFAVPDHVPLSDVMEVTAEQIPFLQVFVSEEFNFERYDYDIAEHAVYDWRDEDAV